MFRITLFGVPVVYDENGNQVKIDRRFTRALLYYLAAQGGPVSRDHLLDYFLQDLPLQKARASLRDGLGKIRSDLPDKELLLATRDTVTLDFRRINVDLLEIETLLGKINTSLSKLPATTPLPLELQRQINQAIKLWGARNFLSGGDIDYSPELDDWLRNTEQKIVENMLRVVKRLAAHEALSGNLEQANRLLLDMIHFDEFDEEIHLAILENYIKGDAIKEARAYYENLEGTYGDPDEYPSKLRALESRFQATHQADLINLPPDWSVRQSLQAPFIGQTEILEQIERANRIGGGVLIYGEAGAGKTRLVQEFFRRQKGGPRLMLASCQPLESGMPFSPWISLLRNSVHPDEWRKLEPSWASAISLLLPELNEILGNKRVFTEKSPEVSRSALLEAIHRTLLKLASKRPIILFLDDVHWADESTLAIIAYLLREEFFSQGRGLLVMAARIEEQNPQLDKFLLTSYPQPVRRIEVPALKFGEVAELCEQVLSRSLPFSIIEQLDQDTGGNPFFLLEILASLQETFPVDKLAEAESLPLPASINELVKARLSTLSAEARELLLVGSVMGSSFDLDIIEKTVAFSAEATIDALDALEAARLIRSIPGDRPIYAFRHEKIRESLLNELSPGRKRLLNQKCAAVLEGYYASQRDLYASKIAIHYEAAGDLLKAFEYWKAAGKNAYRLGSPFDCLESYRRAERLLPRALGLTDEQVYELYVSWIELTYENDDAAELERLSQTLLTLGRERSSDLLIGASHNALAESHMARNQFERAYEAVEAGLSHIVRSGNQAGFAHSRVRKGVYLYMMGRVPEAQEWFIKVLQDTENSTDLNMIQSRASANYQMSTAENLAGYPLRALKYAQQALEDSDYVHSLYTKICAYSAIGLAYYLMSDFVAGREACLQGLVLADQIAGWRLVAYLDIYCGMNELELGMIGQAWKHAQHAIDLGRKYGHGEIVGLGYRIWGDIHTRLENYRKAISAYEQGMSAAGEHFVRLENMHRRGYALFKSGQEPGYRQITQALEHAENAGLGSVLLTGAINELAALVEKHDQALFESKAQWFLEEATRRLGENRPTQALINQFRAELLLGEGKPAEALQVLSELAIECQSKPYRWMEFDCLKLQSAALKQTGEDDTPARQRINEILDELENGLEDAPVLFEWQLFWEKYQTSQFDAPK